MLIVPASAAPAIVLMMKWDANVFSTFFRVGLDENVNKSRVGCLFIALHTVKIILNIFRYTLSEPCGSLTASLQSSHHQWTLIFSNHYTSPHLPRMPPKLQYNMSSSSDLQEALEQACKVRLAVNYLTSRSWWLYAHTRISKVHFLQKNNDK